MRSGTTAGRKALPARRILEANRPLLKDPDEIYPGQVLRIPAEVETATRT